MLKRLVNEARFTLTLITTGPLLIKSGHATLTGPDMTPVLTHRDGRPQVYIPGSSLKGTVRSHIEKVIRTLRPNESVVSDPFVKTGPRPAVGFLFDDMKRRENAPDNPTVYKLSCPATRMFGSTWYIGRVSIDDGYLVDDRNPLPTELRDGIGIDRHTGGTAHGAKFELEVVSAGTQFRTQIVLRNFECWQLGALLMVVQDLEDGLIRVGSGKSRGLGAICAAVSAVEIHTIGLKPANPNDIFGIGRHMSADEAAAYGVSTTDSINVTLPPAGLQRGIRYVRTYSGDALLALKAAAINDFVTEMSHYPTYPRTNTGGDT